MNKWFNCVATLLCAVNLYAGTIYEGVIVDVVQGGGYTYLQVEDAKKKYWVAVEGTKIERGMEVRFQEELRVKNFESKSLNRVFDEIVFGSNLQYRTQASETVNLALIIDRVEKSPYQQSGTLSIKEVWEKRAELNGKTIKIRAKVVKTSISILNRNWIHLQDGTGEGNEVARIVLTSNELPKVGDVVTAIGTVSVDKNFGSGYMYQIIVENTQFQ